MCVEMEVPTALMVASTAWIHISRGVPQLARQSSEFAAETRGTDVFLVNGGTAVAPHQPEDPELSIGETHGMSFSNRAATTQASRIPPGRVSGDRLLSNHQCERQIGPTRHRICKK